MQFQLFDLLSADEYAALKADIARRGVLVPVELDEDGQVLDGHHRTRACEELGITNYPRTTRSGMSDDEKEEHIVTLNVRRRHLDQAAKRKWAEWFLNRHPEWSDRRVAAEVGMSPTTVGEVRGSTVQSGQLATRVGRDGKARPARRPTVTIHSDREQERAQAALTVVTADELPAKSIDLKRLERIAREKEARRRREEAEQSTPPILPRGANDIRHCAIDELDLEPDSVDLIFTDPPYPAEYLDLWSQLGELAAYALKPGRLLVAYTGQIHLPETMRRLAAHLDWWWCYAVAHPGAHQQINARNVRCGWKPLLVFRKPGDFMHDWADDLVSDAPQDKSGHEWQQAEEHAAYWVDRLTWPGDLVVDPFVGAGTTPAACKSLLRRFIGCDIDPLAVTTARERVA
jgi:site-specific DNA-methyltransferase (adenine-specific)